MATRVRCQSCKEPVNMTLPGGVTENGRNYHAACLDRLKYEAEAHDDWRRNR